MTLENRTMDGHSLSNGETLVKAGDDTPADRDRRIPVKDAAMVRRKPAEESEPDTKTAVYPRLPSQNVVDAVYAIKTVGLMSSLFISVVIGCIWILPWVGTNVVIPVVNAFTKFAENTSDTNAKWAETSKSFASMAADSLEEKRHSRAMQESTMGVLKKIEDTLQILTEKK